MSARSGLVPVLAAPMIDPGKGRISAELPYGLTIAEMIDRVLPFPVAKKYIRVALVTPQGSQIVPPEVWHLAKPHAGIHVVIRVIPGKDALRTILQIVVAIAAVAIGAYFAPALAGAFGISQGLAQGIISLGVTVLGNLLINALIPPPKPEEQNQQNRYSISGWRNRVDPDGAIPFVAGTMRYAPPFAALSYSEIVGDLLYIRSFFNFGYGELALDDFRIGETSLAEYDEVEIETREGLEGDAPVSLFPTQRAEESVGAELTYPYPRDDLGNIIEGSSPVETPVTRTTGADASGASVIFAWPGGLFSTDKKKGELRSTAVSIRIQQRLVQAEEWQLVTTLTISAQQREAFYRQHTWSFPSRGRWQIRAVMLTPEDSSLQLQNRTSWAALQTIRPEYPLNFGEPLALVALRIKATHQLNGQLDNFNAKATRICLDYDHVTGAWVKRGTSNPASLYRLALQCSANPRPVADSGIDLQNLQDWHDFCRIKGLKYDRVLDDPSMSIGDILAEIAAAGRAAKRHDGRRWGVVIDRPQDLVVDHFGPRNSYGFKVSRSYFQKPDGFRVKFLDATNDHKPAERLVPWPGHAGEIKLTESLELLGKTDPDEIYREARRRMYEALHRPDVYQISKDGPIGAATRGDQVVLSADTIERTQVVARVRSASGQLIELDDVVTMEDGGAYAVRFRVFEDADDTIGTSVVRTVVTRPGETQLLLVTGDGPLPTAGELAYFGVAGSESFTLVVSGIEAGQDMSCHFRLIDAAPIIDELVDAEDIPAWSGRVGAEIDENLLQPPAPRFTSIASGFSGTDQSGLVTYLIEPGAGSMQASQFQVEHRLVGAPSWTVVTIPAANGGGSINTYTNGNEVQLRALSISPAGTPGPYTAVITFTVGESDAAIPGALDLDMISVGALLGAAIVQFATGDDTSTTQLQIYRSTSNVLDRETDADGAPVAVEPSRSYSVPIGDMTRQTLILNGGFDSAGTWSAAAPWSIASGKATKAGGTGGAIGQPLAVQVGKYYRLSFEISGMTVGSLTPRLNGGSIRAGTARAANGSWTDRIQAVSGNNTFEFQGTTAFDGSIDNVAVYLETATCLSQGTHYFWLEPQNEDGVPGPVAGPFSVTIK